MLRSELVSSSRIRSVWRECGTKWNWIKKTTRQADQMGQWIVCCFQIYTQFFFRVRSDRLDVNNFLQIWMSCWIPPTIFFSSSSPHLALTTSTEIIILRHSTDINRLRDSVIIRPPKKADGLVILNFDDISQKKQTTGDCRPRKRKKKKCAINRREIWWWKIIISFCLFSSTDLHSSALISSPWEGLSAIYVFDFFLSSLLYLPWTRI